MLPLCGPSRCAGMAHFSRKFRGSRSRRRPLERIVGMLLRRLFGWTALLVVVLASTERRPHIVVVGVSGDARCERRFCEQELSESNHARRIDHDLTRRVSNDRSTIDPKRRIKPIQSVRLFVIFKSDPFRKCMCFVHKLVEVLSKAETSSPPQHDQSPTVHFCLVHYKQSHTPQWCSIRAIAMAFTICDSPDTNEPFEHTHPFGRLFPLVLVVPIGLQRTRPTGLAQRWMGSNFQRNFLKPGGIP